MRDVVVGTCLDRPRLGLLREHLLLGPLLVPRRAVPWSFLSTRTPSIHEGVYNWIPFPRPNPPSDWPKGNDWVERDGDLKHDAAARGTSVEVVVTRRSVRAVGDLLMMKGSSALVAVVSATLEDSFVDPEFLPGFGGKWDSHALFHLGTSFEDEPDLVPPEESQDFGLVPETDGELFVSLNPVVASE